MIVLTVGIAVFVVTVAVFLYCLPRGGKMHRFVGTGLEPYVTVAICAGIALGVSMIVSGAMTLTSAP
jgi:hypothetical protein